MRAVLVNDLAETEHVSVSVECEVIVLGAEIGFCLIHLLCSLSFLRLSVELLVAQNCNTDYDDCAETAPNDFFVFIEEFFYRRYFFCNLLVLQSLLIFKSFLCHIFLCFLFRFNAASA